MRNFPEIRPALVTLALVTLACVPRVAHTQSRSASDTLLSLAGAIRSALELNGLVAAGRFEVEQANARVRQANAALLPSLSMVAGNRQRTLNTAEFGLSFPAREGEKPFFSPEGEVLGPVNVYDARLRMSHVLVGPTARPLIMSVRSSARATEAGVSARNLQVASQVATAYLRLERASAQLTARTADSVLAAELLTVAREQLRAGVGVALDVTRAESQLAATRAQLIGARAERDRSELDLSRVVGLPLDVRIRPADSLSAARTLIASPEIDAAVQQAIARRPEVVEIQAQVEAAQRRLSATNAERYPTLTGFMDDGLIGKTVSNLKNTYTWGLQVSVPLLDPRRSARVQEQNAEIHALEVRRHDVERTVAVDVRTALLDLVASRETVAATGERLRLAEQEVAQARDRFRAGVAGNADVINASISLNAARTTYVDALASFEAARLGLARAQGITLELQ